MNQRIEEIVGGVLSAFQAARIYTTKHKGFQSACAKTYALLQEALAADHEIVLGLVGDEFVYEKEVLFGVSKRGRALIDRLQEVEIERIAFTRGLQERELTEFLTLLSDKQKESGSDIESTLASSRVKHIQVGKLTVLPDGSFQTGEGPKNAPNSLELCDKQLDQLSQSVDALLNHETVDILDLRATAGSILENLTQNYSALLKLTTVKNYDIDTYVHILNVSILSMFFSSQLGYAREDVLSIGLAALFHDIGKVYIARKIIKKAGRLDPKELDKVKGHSSLGARFLLNYVDSLGTLPVVVAYEHHIRFDGKGYPVQTYKPDGLHPASLIVSICDVYDALTQKRVYKESFPPNQVHRIMMQERGALFDPELLDLFYRFMGVWPLGVVVTLTDGRIAVVREVNYDDIYQPKVEVIHPEPVKKILDLRENGGQIGIQEALDPMGDGKKFLDMV